MVLVRFSFGAFLVLGFATACSSSSTGAQPMTDASMSSGDASDAGNGLGIMASCGLLSMVGGGASGSCPSGQTCCTLLALPPSASCVPNGSCTTGIATECSKAADCMTGQVCCAGSADAGPMAAMDAGMAMFNPSSLSTTCQASCTASQAQYCTADADCPTGLTCQALAAGGLGGLFMVPNFCAAPPVDAGMVVDAGTPVVDSGTPPADAGTADTATE